MTQPPRAPGRSGPARRPGPHRTAGRATTGRPSTGGRSSTGGPGAVPPPRSSDPRATQPGRATQHRTAAPEPARSAARPAGTRRPAASGAARRTTAPQPHRFTSRATVLGLVLGALLLAYAYPVRIYLEQQNRIAALEASQAAQQERIRQLTDESAKWEDPTFVATQAKETLQMVKPGDTVYFVSRAAPTAPAASDPDAGRARDTGPWYGQLWSSLQAADKPRPAP